MADAAVQDVPVELGTELAAVVGLDGVDAERELLADVVEELNRGDLVVLVVDTQHAQPGAVVDRGVLVVARFPCPFRGSMNLTSIWMR